MMRGILRLVSLCLGGLVTGALVLSGCASGSRPSMMQPIMVPTQTAPPVSSGDYVVRPGDVLEVKFYYHPEHNQTVAVRPDGKVLLPAIGDVEAAGMTPEKLSEVIETRYVNLRDPKVSINVQAFADKTFLESQVYVGGEVARAGIYKMKQGITVLQAIFQAGGFRDTADIEKIVLLRPLGENRFAYREIDLNKILTNEDPTSNLVVLQEDVIFVPKTGIAKANLWVQQYIRDLLPFGGTPVRFETVPLP